MNTSENTANMQTAETFNFGDTQPLQFSQAQPWTLPQPTFTPKQAERHNRRIFKNADYEQGSYQPIEGEA